MCQSPSLHACKSILSLLHATSVDMLTQRIRCGKLPAISTCSAPLRQLRLELPPQPPSHPRCRSLSSPRRKSLKVSKCARASASGNKSFPAASEDRLHKRWRTHMRRMRSRLGSPAFIVFLFRVEGYPSENANTSARSGKAEVSHLRF